jgi:hypothetical protein
MEHNPSQTQSGIGVIEAQYELQKTSYYYPLDDVAANKYTAAVLPVYIRGWRMATTSPGAIKECT